MRVEVGAVRGTVARMMVLAAVLGGCASTPDGDDPKASSSASAASRGTGAAGTPAKAGGSIGAAGSACELPVTFDIAKDWKPKAVEVGKYASPADSSDGDDDLAGDLADALLHQGPVTLACEVDAKPAGNIGFLRVWKGEPGDADARAVLRSFVAAEDNTSKEKYRAFESGGVSGVEVEYVYTSKLLDESKKESALAVTTEDGPVVLHLGGMDSEEHEQMLPAYELAKRSLRIA
ncbi:lipoprotein [Streptomyces sp. NPDC001480]|uniref:lipoprotein n=1 Tax=Streptomyces sp. NPDC001480 TaxID=3364577 RepID=UPI0036B4FA7C